MHAPIKASWRKKKGVWYARFQHPVTGVRVERSTGCGNRKLAEAWLTKEWERLLAPDKAALPDVALATAAARYLAGRQNRIDAGAEDADAPSTFHARKKTWRLLVEHFGADTIVHELDATHMVAFREERLAVVSAHTVYKNLCELRTFFRWCIERGLVRRNPAKDVTVSYKIKKQDRAITPDQFLALYEAVAAKRRLYVLLMVETGARPGREVEAITWGDLDVGGPRIHIPGTKTAAADRFIPIRPQFAAHLLEQRGSARDSDPIVERWSNARRDLSRAAKKAGLEHVRPYDLRHTYASWALQGGAPDAHVAKALGHSSTAMVHQVYGHLRPEHLQSVVSALPVNGVLEPTAAVNDDQEPEQGGCGDDSEPENGAEGPESGPNEPRGLPHICPNKGPEGADSGSNPHKTENPATRVSCRVSKENAVPRGGFEPPTRGFSVRCSTN